MTYAEFLEGKIYDLTQQRAELLEALKKAQKLLEVSKVVTVGQVIDAGDWAVEAVGLNPYCLNEGRCTRDSLAFHPWDLDFLAKAITQAEAVE